MVVKLDIDTPAIEQTIIAVLAQRPDLAALIDELFFEYHFDFDGLDFGWGTIVQGDVDKAEQGKRESGSSATFKKLDKAPRRGSVMGTLQSVAKAATVMQSNRRANPQVQPSDDGACCQNQSCSSDTSASAPGPRSSPCANAMRMALASKDPPS